MTILLLNQFFWPDSAATSQLLTDLARGLAERGHHVHAICVHSGYAPEDRTDPPAVHIHRTKAAPFLRGIVGRVASYASFFLGAVWQGLRVPRPDVVITLTTPPLLSLVGTLVQTFRGARHFIWEMDVYPDVAVDLNYFKRGSVLDRIVGLLADFARKRCDGILALGPCMRDRLVNRGIASSKIYIADNWADGKSIRPVPWPPAHDPLTVLYSGNLGLAHDVETIREAMKSLKNDGRFRFVFAGSGARRAELERWCQVNDVQNAEFRPYSAKAHLGDSLGSGHIGLITQKDACLGSVVPSKLYGLLAAGRPVLFIGPKASTVGRILLQFRCGWQVDCGDTPTLLHMLEELAATRSEVERAGERAREAFLANYDLPHGVSRICAIIGASSDQEIAQSLKVFETDAVLTDGREQR